jgi:hypothetical protein
MSSDVSLPSCRLTSTPYGSTAVSPPVTSSCNKPVNTSYRNTPDASMRIFLGSYCWWITSIPKTIALEQYT